MSDHEIGLLKGRIATLERKVKKLQNDSHPPVPIEDVVLKVLKEKGLLNV